MQLYLPIAELPVNIFILLGVGAAVGFVSGMFGIGGGFLLTPLLIFLGVAAPVAIATSSVHIAASSFTGVLSHFRKNALDFRLGFFLIIGGVCGTILGVISFNQLRKFGYLTPVISVSYVILLLSLGGVMFIETIMAMIKHHNITSNEIRIRNIRWYERLPLIVYFPRSKMSTSIIPILFLGMIIGFIGAVLGIGGGFLIVPALIYLFRVPTSVIIGTSMFQLFVTMVISTLLHSVISQAVDAVLALTLVAGGVFGAQFGTNAGKTLKGEHFRLLLALLILMVGYRFAVDIFATPVNQYYISSVEIER